MISENTSITVDPKKIGLSLFLLFCSVFVFSQPQRPSLSQVADQFEKAWRDKQPLPAVSKLVPEITLEQGYDVQRDWVKRTMTPAEIGGIKAGLVGVASQQSLGVKEPLGGFLRAAGRIDDTGKNILRRKNYTGLKLETEIGIVIGKRMEKAPGSIEELKIYVSGIAPVIELVGGEWDNPGGKANPANFAATNLSAVGYIVGKAIAPDVLDLRDVHVKFTRNGELMHEGDGAECWQGPWETALWLAQFAERQGVVLEPGQVLICGAMGEVHAGEKGKYVMDAGTLGKLPFKIK